MIVRHQYGIRAHVMRLLLWSHLRLHTVHLKEGGGEGNCGGMWWMCGGVGGVGGVGDVVYGMW